LFYGKVYKGKKTDMPSVYNSTKPENSSDLDPDLQMVIDKSITPTDANCEVSFWADSLVQSTSIMTVYNIMGKEVHIEGKTPQITEKIKKFNSSINNMNETVEDYIRQVWQDNLTSSKSLWRVGPRFAKGRNKPDTNIEILRIPPGTINIGRDSMKGWRKFQQNISSYTTFRDYSSFLKSTSNTYTGTINMTGPINIADEPQYSLYVSLFDRAPMAALNHLVVMKRWIYWFIRKFAEKTWSRIFLAKIGDPKTNYYPEEEEMEAAQKAVTKTLLRLKNHGAASVPGNVEVKTFEPNSSGEIFLKYIDHIDSKIMLGLYASMSLREAVGVYKAGEDGVNDHVRFMEGVRKQIERSYNLMLVSNVVPEAEVNEIKWHWPELRTVEYENIAKAYDICCNNATFIDLDERRKAATKLFPFLLDRIPTEKEITEKDTFFELMKSPSPPSEEGSSTSVIKGNSKTDKKATKSPTK